jgi:hypothetical protein
MAAKSEQDVEVEYIQVRIVINISSLGNQCSGSYGFRHRGYRTVGMYRYIVAIT